MGSETRAASRKKKQEPVPQENLLLFIKNLKFIIVYLLVLSFLDLEGFPGPGWSLVPIAGLNVLVVPLFSLSQGS